MKMDINNPQHLETAINTLVLVCEKLCDRIDRLEVEVDQLRDSKKYLESRVDQLENPNDTKYTG